MSARPPGRRTESLFDNRFRYDHIFPRGRSGETLRAYDTQQGDRPVVVKRPAPQDAPPMRAGQEVSIRNERHALERLSGHPVLIELCGSGTFRVGGHTHEYIVLELAEGLVIEDCVLELAKDDRTLPELESLVIVDHLLDLLAFAHEKNVIYNDVDAKHLFWSRERYQLKVIDWGNAVFPDEPGALPSVTRASDIHQCGELLYFIFTGGMRLTTDSGEGEAFFVDFGPHAERIPARLQALLTRAVHPDARRRFGSITELREALADYRQPLERVRDEIIARVRKRVRPTASQQELEQLAAELEDAAAMDPGFPETRALAGEIDLFRRQIMVQADLDAIRIYLESGNWPRALSLLDDLLPEADPASEGSIRFLMSTAAICEQLRISPPPAGFIAALDALFAGDTALAGHTLLTTPEARPLARDAQWLIAEQLSTITGLMLLRPHLVRLKTDLAAAPGGGDRPLNALRAAAAQLEVAPSSGVAGLRTLYEDTGRSLEHLSSEIERASRSWPSGDRDAALASVARARDAARAIVAQLDAVSQTAVSDPRHAGELLRAAAAIDPLSPYFDAVNDYLDEVHQALDAIAQFKPRADGANLTEWFRDVVEFLRPYLDDLRDPRLRTAADSVQRAAEGWRQVESNLALGRRQPSIDTLRATADLIRPINEHLAAWLGTLANRIPDAVFVERHSVNARLADVLIDGWKAWDRGDPTRALDLARKAQASARTEGEQLSAERLRRLSELLAGWLAEGTEDQAYTARAEKEALAILLVDEEQERRIFAEQMPSASIYLRTMGRGIVAYLHQSSSAGWRALYLHYVLRGAAALLQGDLEDAEFWRSAAAKTFDDAPAHPAYQILERALAGRRLVETTQAALNAISGPADLDRARRALNVPLAAELLGGAEQSVQMATQAVRDWSDGDFYAARQNLDIALDDIQRARGASDLQIESYVAWLSRLRDAAGTLQAARLEIEQAAARPGGQVDPALADAHRRIIDLTLSTLGPDYAHQVRQWHDTFQSVLDTYTASHLNRREKLAAFNRHFSSLFITKHPAYPLYRHWESIIEQLPPDEPETSASPPPRAARVAAPPLREDGEELTFLLDDAEPPAADPDDDSAVRERSDLRWNWIIGGAIVALLAVLAGAALRSRSSDGPAQGDLVRSGRGLSAAQAATRPAPTAAETRAAVIAPTLAPSPTPIPATTAPAATGTPEPSPTAPPPSPTLFVTGTLAPSRAAAAGGPLREAPPDTSVLHALRTVPEGNWPWDPGAFYLGSGDRWRLDTGPGVSGEVTIALDPALLSALFGPGVANTLTSARAVVELVEYDAAEMADGDVTLGLGAINTSGQSAIGTVQFQEPAFVGLGIAQNGMFRARSEAELDESQIELSLRRVNANTLGFYVNDILLGDSVVVFPEGAPITLALAAGGRGTVVEVREFEVEFSPRSDLP